MCQALVEASTTSTSLHAGTQQLRAAQLPRRGQGARAAPPGCSGGFLEPLPGARQPAPGMLGLAITHGAGCSLGLYGGVDQ